MIESNYSRLCVALSAAIWWSAPAAAQIPGSVPERTETPPQPSIEDRIAGLEAELEKLRLELRFIESVRASGGLKAAIADRLKQRKLTPPSIEVGIGSLFKPYRAKVFTEEQKQNLLDDVAMTVNDVPIRDPRINALYEYLRSYQPEANRQQLMERTLLSIIASEWPKSHFSRFRGENNSKIRNIHSQAVAGLDFAVLAENRSDHRESAVNGGDLGFIGREDGLFGLNFAMMAFSTPLNEVSPVFASPYGLHILKPLEYERGETPDKDRVRVSHVLVLHAPDPDEVMGVMEGAEIGQAKILVRDQELIGFLPKPYR